MDGRQTVLAGLIRTASKKDVTALIDRVAQFLGVPADRFYCNIQCFGNTSSASMLIAAAEYFESRPMTAKPVVFAAFGAGMQRADRLVTKNSMPWVGHALACQPAGRQAVPAFSACFCLPLRSVPASLSRFRAGHMRGLVETPARVPASSRHSVFQPPPVVP